MADLTRGQKISRALRRHGMSHSPTYRSWASMKNRCFRKAERGYEHYGGKGITVCQRWMVFANFLADMGVRPNGTTLDRKDINLGYFRENCTWSDRKTQNTNKSNVRLITHLGETLSMSDWAVRLGISKQSMFRRISKWHESRWFEDKRTW